MKKIALLLLYSLILTGCYTLKAPATIVNDNIHHYKYAYIIPAMAITASAGGSGGSGYYEQSPTHTVSPTDVISSYFMRKGFAILPKIDDSRLSETIIVNYGHVGTKRVFTFWRSNIVMIQCRDAQTHELIVSSEAEGYNGDDAQDIMQAIMRALDAMFQ